MGIHKLGIVVIFFKAENLIVLLDVPLFVLIRQDVSGEGTFLRVCERLQAIQS